MKSSHFYDIINNDTRGCDDLKRGQALVEFVIILPIFIFLLLAIIDIGKMISIKNQLESTMSSVIEEYESQNSIQEIEQKLKKEHTKILLETNEDNGFMTIYLKEEISILTPGLNLLFPSPYQVTVERSIKNE